MNSGCYRSRRLSVVCAAMALMAGAWTAQASPDPEAMLRAGEDAGIAAVRGRAEMNGPRVMVDRAPPPVAGGGCQASGDFINTYLATVTTGFLVSTANPPTQMFADNFRVPAGPGVSLSSISWSGTFTLGASPNIGYAIPTGVSFVVTVFSDSSGVPGAQVSSQTVTPTFVQAAGDSIASGNALPGVQALPVYDFTATLPSSVNLSGGACYWIEIRPTPNGVSGGAPNGATYIWRASPQGDGVLFVRTSTGFFYAAGGVVNGDAAFCVNFASQSVADGLSCALGTTLSCFTQGSPNGQTWDGTTTALAASAPTGGTEFALADNFSITSQITITGGCFQGVYNGTPLPTATTEVFQITFLADNGGVPGAAVAGPLTVGTGQSDGTTLRSSTGFSSFFFTTTGRTWTFTLGTPVTLNPGCYWIQIQNRTATTNRWFWLLKNNGRSATIADRFLQLRNVSAGQAYALDTQTFEADTVWALTLQAGSGTIQRTQPACSALPDQANRTCAGAVTLPLNGSVSAGNNVRDIPLTQALPPSCIDRQADTRGVFFKVVGDGSTVTVSTCDSNTSFDTVLMAYCTQNDADPCAGPLVCLAANDVAGVPPGTTNTCGSAQAGADASELSFATVAGKTYIVYLCGFLGDGGTYGVFATSNGVPSGAVACAGLTPCRIDIPAGATAESDACGVAGTNAACSTIPTLAMGGTATGSAFATGTRDIDFWKINTGVGAQWIQVTVRSEFPALLLFARTCPTTGANAPALSAQLLVNACEDAPETNGEGQPIRFYVPAGGNVWVGIAPFDFNGLPCDGLRRGNRYWFKVEPAVTGVCCVQGTFCTATVSTNGVNLTTDPSEGQDCLSLNGTYLGDGTVCDTANPPMPCDGSGGPPVTAVVGSCCASDGGCTMTVSTACPSGFNAGGSCAPGACPVLVSRCCSITSGTCVVRTAADCAAAGGVSLAGAVCTPNSCAQQASGRCCSASTGGCVVSAAFECTAAGLSWTAGGSCSPNVCPAFGACCSNTGSCTYVLQTSCAAGNPFTAGIGCTPNQCPPVQTCCTGTTCALLAPFGCVAGGGTVLPGASCSPSPCVASGVCCRGTTCNTTIAQGSCTAPSAGIGAVFAVGGLGNNCNAMNNRAAPCCYADFNKTAGVTVQDIFDYLAAWFAGSPYARYAGDGTGGAATAQSIFDFLAAWFLGPCPAYP